MFASVAMTAVAAVAGSIASRRAEEFYHNLDRPAWAPPSEVFGPVWTLLYCLMAVAAWLVWKEGTRRSAVAVGIYAVHLVFNALWSWLFFAWRQGSWAFLEVLVLWAFIILTIVLFWRVRKIAALLLVPYLLWVSFAAALTYSVWQGNPGLLR